MNVYFVTKRQSDILMRTPTVHVQEFAAILSVVTPPQPSSCSMRRCRAGTRNWSPVTGGQVYVTDCASTCGTFIDKGGRWEKSARISSTPGQGALRRR